MATTLLDSVVSIESRDDSFIYRGSGALLSGGRYVLTAAHLFDRGQDASDFELRSGIGALPSIAAIHVYPGWDSSDSGRNHDIALIELSEPVSGLSGFELWSGNSPVGSEFTFAGYGGDSGFHTGTNILDGDGALFNLIYPLNVLDGVQVLYDYDNGTDAQDALGNLFGAGTASVTSDESIAESGDSGGPLLIDDEIVAVSSYTFRNSAYDINGTSDSSAGEIAGATLITPYLPWIEEVTQGNTQYSPPTSKEEVITEVSEPFSGSVTNYFLLEMPTAKIVTVSLQYTTRDGTATSGEDYEAASGVIELAPGETQYAIPVTVFGDTQLEDNETFSVVVTDPTGFWIEAGVELIATHTIINNDIVG